MSLKREQGRQVQAAKNAGAEWSNKSLVIPSEAGTARDAANVRRSLRAVAKAAGLNEKEWSPLELRHTFVSLLTDSGMVSEEISKLVGHSGTEVTETVYRHQLRPVIRSGALAMDALFPTEGAETAGSEHSETDSDQDR